MCDEKTLVTFFKSLRRVIALEVLLGDRPVRKLKGRWSEGEADSQCDCHWFPRELCIWDGFSELYKLGLWVWVSLPWPGISQWLPCRRRYNTGRGNYVQLGIMPSEGHHCTSLEAEVSSSWGYRCIEYLGSTPQYWSNLSHLRRASPGCWSFSLLKKFIMKEWMQNFCLFYHCYNLTI